MKKIFNRVANSVVTAFYPSVCVSCGQVVKGIGLCEDCKQTFKMVKEPTCSVCGKYLKGDGLMCEDCKDIDHIFKRNVSLFEYKGAIKEAIYKFKYANKRSSAEFFAFVAEGNYGKLLEEWNIDAIVPVPMWSKKAVSRGYNQAEEFGFCLSKYTGIKIDKTLLIRNKNTVPMKGLSNQKRYENLKSAFSVDVKEAKRYRNVLVVDDIFTTGTTIDACARVLKRAGVEKVYSMCIATGS